MGTLYRQAGSLITPQPGEIWIEIGSDRWEGSSVYFGELAREKDVKFYSIDHDESASQRIRHSHVQWQISDGLAWCRRVLPTLNCQVGLVYLDNFDYAWDINHWDTRLRDQRKEYQERFGLEMNNQNCQVAHLQQFLAIEPYLTDCAIVICDDTYTLNDCWVGKGGGVVLYLLAKGWNLVKAEDFGVILQPCNA